VKLVLCLTAVAAAGMLAACGGGGGSDGGSAKASDPPSQLTKARFVQKANRLCSQFNSTIGQFFKTTNALSDVPDIYEGFIQRLQSLGGPNEARLRALIGAGYEIDDAYVAMGQGVIHQDQGEVARAGTEIAKAKANFASAARRYGLTGCSHGQGFTGGAGFSPPSPG
jgi:hypothetical protein